MRVFKNKWFNKFAKKEHITDLQLCELIENIEKGLIDADYGGGVIKQRLGRLNKGKSSGYRCIILYRYKDISFLVYGLPKNERDNISKRNKYLKIYHNKCLPFRMMILINCAYQEPLWR